MVISSKFLQDRDKQKKVISAGRLAAYLQYSCTKYTPFLLCCCYWICTVRCQCTHFCPHEPALLMNHVCRTPVCFFTLSMPCVSMTSVSTVIKLILNIIPDFLYGLFLGQQCLIISNETKSCLLNQLVVFSCRYKLEKVMKN